MNPNATNATNATKARRGFLANALTAVGLVSFAGLSTTAQAQRRSGLTLRKARAEFSLLAEKLENSDLRGSTQAAKDLDVILKYLENLNN